MFSISSQSMKWYGVRIIPHCELLLGHVRRNNYYLNPKSLWSWNPLTTKFAYEYHHCKTCMSFLTQNRSSSGQPQFTAFDVNSTTEACDTWPRPNLVFLTLFASYFLGTELVRQLSIPISNREQRVSQSGPLILCECSWLLGVVENTEAELQLSYGTCLKYTCWRRCVFVVFVIKINNNGESVVMKICSRLRIEDEPTCSFSHADVVVCAFRRAI